MILLPSSISELGDAVIPEDNPQPERWVIECRMDHHPAYTWLRYLHGLHSNTKWPPPPRKKKISHSWSLQEAIAVLKEAMQENKTHKAWRLRCAYTDEIIPGEALA